MATPAADPGRDGDPPADRDRGDNGHRDDRSGEARAGDGSPGGGPDGEWFDGETILNLFGIVVVLAVIATIVFVGLLVAGGDGGESIAPETDWTLTRINDSHVRIVHAGGEPVDAGSLVVTADGRERHPDWSAETLTEGDGGTFRATGARSVVRLWIEVGADRELLESWDLS